MKLIKQNDRVKEMATDLMSFLMVGSLVFVMLMLVEPFSYGMRAGVSIF